jgi:hypothetical protein
MRKISAYKEAKSTPILLSWLLSCLNNWLSESTTKKEQIIERMTKGRVKERGKENKWMNERMNNPQTNEI